MCVAASCGLPKRQGNRRLDAESDNFIFAGGGRSRAVAGVQRDRLSQSAGICQRPVLSEGHRTEEPGATHPGTHDLPTAFSYFLKSAELNLAAGNWQAICGRYLALLGSRSLALTLADSGDCGRFFCCGIPLPFYSLSVAYGGVPIFMPVWWPFSYYNVRYGLELLPAFAVFASPSGVFLDQLGAIRRRELE